MPVRFGTECSISLAVVSGCEIEQPAPGALVPFRRYCHIP